MAEADNAPIGSSNVTNVAGLVGDDMRIVFARGLNTVVAGCAGARYNLAMIETHHIPGLR